MKGLMADEGKSHPRLVGIGKASVFPGFCGRHDDVVFKPVEEAEIPLHREHAFLLAYRAIAYERFHKECQVRATELQRKMDCGKPFLAQAAVQTQLNALLFGIRMGLADIERTKNAFDAMLLSGDRTDFHYHAVRFDALLPMVACGAFHVEQDFEGNRLQRLGRGSAPFELITLTVTAFQGRTIAVLGWIDDRSGPAAKFAESFDALPDDRKADALLRVLFVQTDNMYLRPSWWGGLDAADKEFMVDQIMAGTPISPRMEGALSEDGRHLLTAGVVEKASG